MHNDAVLVCWKDFLLLKKINIQKNIKSNIYYANTMEKHITTITYPEDYDGVWVGIGGCLKAKESKADKAYWRGRKPFGKATRYYSKKKTNFHFMRITK